jgi:outer membrane protein TolC
MLPAFRPLDRLVRAVLLVALLAAPGCLTMKPEPMTAEEVERRNAETRRLLEAENEELPQKLTLEWAFARALRQNLDHRVKAMETAIAFGQFDLAKFETLPKLTAEAGYYSRNNESIVRSRDSVTRLPSLANPSISSDRNHLASSVGPSWSLLDFGTSYFSAKQAGDRALSALERRRKSTHLLFAEVRSAFWRVAIAQRVGKEIKANLAEAEEGLAEARRLEKERLRAPGESLRLQKGMLENIQQLEAIQLEMASAQVELAHLLVVPPSVTIVVDEPDFVLPPGLEDFPADTLETAALAHNPDVAVALYDARIAQQEARKAITKLFPSVTFDYDIHRDTDSYMINESWNTASARISFDLFKLATIGRDLKNIERSEELAQRRQMAVLMGVVAQIHLVRLEYGAALHAYRRADETSAVDGRLRDISMAYSREEVQSRLDVVTARTSAILSLARRYHAIVQAQAVIGRMQSTLGLDPLPDPVADLTTKELADRLEDYMAAWKDGSWVQFLAARPPRPATSPSPSESR